MLMIQTLLFALGDLGLGYFFAPIFDKPVIESMVVLNLCGIAASFMLDEMLHPKR